MKLPALFLDLVNTSISAGWLVLGILILRMVMQKAPKWLTCSLWALVAIRLVMPFSIESMFSLIPSTQTLPPEIMTGNQFEVNTGIPVVNQHINNEILGSYYEGVTAPVDNSLNMISVAGLIWLAGMVLLVLYSVISYLHLRRKVSASIRLQDNVYLCDYIASPFILGIFRPRIYIPSTLDEANRSHVLAHENSHLKRRDHWWKPLGFALLCIHWFNPLMWLAYILLCRDIELACDEKVIRELGETGKVAYSRALLECSMPRYLIAACPLAFGEVGVKDRVRSILNYRKPAFWIVAVSLILCILTAICFLTDPVTEPEGEAFIGTVVSTGSGSVTVEPQAGSDEAKSADRIEVVLPQDAPAVQDGDMVRIEYDGLIEETYPARIPNVIRIEVLNELEYVSRTYSVSRSIQEGYAAMVNGDAVANQDMIHDFYLVTQAGSPASIRLASYYTIGDPRRMSEELFEESREKYPVLYIYDLSYDGKAYTLRWFEGEEELTETWQYLMPYTQEPPSKYTPWISRSGYVLTDRNDVTYDQLWDGMLSADFNDQIPFHEIFSDPVYENEPIAWTLNKAQYALEEHMASYKIAGMHVNEHTNRLEIEVYEWVDGLFDLIEQYIDPHFVTVTEVRHTIAFTGTCYNTVEDAIRDGCYTTINGDAVSGQDAMEDFLRKAERNEPAAIRLVDYLTLSSPVNYDPGDFPDIFARYPVISVSDLIFDGTQYILHAYSDGKASRHVFQFLHRYSGVTYGSRVYEDYFVLTDMEALSFDDFIFSIGMSSRNYGRPLCSDVLFGQVPTDSELEAARTSLESHIAEYRITSMAVNTLTHRLDITVSEWVDGLDTLIREYIDIGFVTIVHENGLAHLAAENDLALRFPDYFGLQVYRGLEIYALPDGFVLVSPATNDSTEAEILALPKATAEEMAQILQSYAHWGVDYEINNRTNLTEYEILKMLGIYPECSVNAALSDVTPESARLTLTIYNLDDKEVWADQSFLLEVMTEDGWVTCGSDPETLTWDTALLFHRKGTGPNPSQTSFYTKESVECTVSWSAVGQTPLPAGEYRFRKTIQIRDGDDTRSHHCYAIFTIP